MEEPNPSLHLLIFTKMEEPNLSSPNSSVSPPQTPLSLHFPHRRHPLLPPPPPPTIPLLLPLTRSKSSYGLDNLLSFVDRRCGGGGFGSLSKKGLTTRAPAASILFAHVSISVCDEILDLGKSKVID
ncbi:hypothetical protein LguiB_006689 [Lonicera macranthoides]